MLITDIQSYKPVEVPVIPTVYFDDLTLAAEAHGELVFDIESFPNYFLIAFKSFKTGLALIFEHSPETTIDLAKLLWVCKNFTLIGFNSARYDVPMLEATLGGLSTERLHDLSNAIILGGRQPGDLEPEYGYQFVTLDHIDLFEVAVGRQISLKTYGARMHVPRLQDLPFDPQQWLTRDDAVRIREYCLNDLDITAYLYAQLTPEINLRKDLTKEYRLDLRSKSDSQIAEAVISKEIKEVTGKRPSKKKLVAGTSFEYKVPDYLVFENNRLNAFVDKIAETRFVLNDKGEIEIPKVLRRQIIIGNSTYQFGVGGLHSIESSVKHIATKEFAILDRDVASYYPAIIMNQGLYPEQLGKEFLDVYKNIVAKRLRAKKKGDKLTSKELKIVINGSFGKFGNKYSILYSPDLLMQVTLTGQLSLLMLIEAIESIDNDVNVISANTDGFVSRVPRTKYDQFLAHVYEWEERTGFDTEETEYKALFSRDVNNYFAIKIDDTYKLKGTYSIEAGSPPSILGKNPVNQICVDAILDLLIKGVPIENTIFNCKDITKFLTVRKVTGGAIKDTAYLGKTIRWYYKKNEFGCIRYANSGNKVPKTDGAWPWLYLGEFPKDIDYQWYFRETMSILKDIGYFGEQFKQLELF